MYIVFEFIPLCIGRNRKKTTNWSGVSSLVSLGTDVGMNVSLVHPFIFVDLRLERVPILTGNETIVAQLLTLSEIRFERLPIEGGISLNDICF